MPKKAVARPAPAPTRLPTALGIVALVSSGLLLLGAFARAGQMGALSMVWTAWGNAGPVVRFIVMLTILAGLFGAGSWAMTLSWKRFDQVNLLAASAFLVATISLIVGATYNKQWGASTTMPMVLGILVAIGFMGVFYALYRRITAKAAGATTTPAKAGEVEFRSQ